jgi:hypothetical protein
MIGIEIKIAQISANLKGVRNGEATSIAIIEVVSGKKRIKGSAIKEYI